LRWFFRWLDLESVISEGLHTQTPTHQFLVFPSLPIQRDSLFDQSLDQIILLAGHCEVVLAEQFLELGDFEFLAKRGSVRREHVVWER
jgi:hypothetical protein